MLYASYGMSEHAHEDAQAELLVLHLIALAHV